ncbi:MAG: hypothetical protein ACOCUU_00330 [Nanoarchaeota archaeon]
MVGLRWCKKQKKGIEIIEPNENLVKEYLQTAKETTIEIVNENSNMPNNKNQRFLSMSILKTIEEKNAKQ